MTDYLAYFRIMGIDSQEHRSKYLRLMQRLDRAFLKHVHESSQASK